MSDYRDAGKGLIQSGDVPFVNQFGDSPRRVASNIAPTGASEGTSTPGGGGAPTLSLSAYVINFATTTGGANPPSQIIEVTNSGTGTLEFEVATIPSWLVITPSSGAAPSTLTLSVLNAGLEAGYSGAFVTITAVGALGSPALLEVFLTVTADWNLPVVAKINKPAWLGYFKTATFNGEYTTTACTGTANACIVSRGDFGTDPESNDWAKRQRTAATQIAALGGKIFIGADEREILNMKGQWDTVGGIYTALEAATPTPESIEQVIRDTRAIIRREGLENRIFATYIDSATASTLTKWINGMDWLMLGVYLPYAGEEAAVTVQSRGAALISTSMATITPLMPAGSKVMLAAQAFDRGVTGPGGQWDNTTLTYLQKVYPDALRAYTSIYGIFWFCYERSGIGVDGHPDLIPWHQATYQAISGTPAVEVPASGPYGVLQVCTTTTISGWAYDTNYPNEAITVQIYDGPGVLGVNTNRIAQLATSASTYAFSIATPAAFLDGASHSVYVYAVSRSSPVYQTLLVSAPQTVKLDAGSVGMTTSGRSFFYTGSSLVWKGATAFMAIKILLDGGSMDAKLNYWQGKGINCLRVFGMIGGEGIWTGWGFNPSTPGYYAAWNTLLTACASRGIVVEACIMADTSVIPPYNTQAARKVLVQQFVSTLASHKNFVVELCNEPWHPYNSNMTVANLIELAQIVKATQSSRLVTFGASAADETTEFNVSPTSYLAVHSSRDSEWGWVTNLFLPSNPNVSQSTLPVVDNEPINSTSASSSQVDPDPARWYAYGLACQLRQLSSTYHYGAGKFTDLPTGDALTCLDQWYAGRTDVSWSWGGDYFHGFYPSVGNSPFYRVGSEILCMGRSTSRNAVALVVAPSGWTPSLRPGWTATVTRSVADTAGSYTAFFLTLSYT